MKKILATILGVAMLLTAVGCNYNDNLSVSSDEESSSNTVTSSENATLGQSSEYPSSSASSEVISSAISSDVSSVVSQVASANSSSAKPSSTPPSSAKPSSTKPSSPPPSSEPPSSESPSSTPVQAPAKNSEYMKAVWISFLEFQSFAGSSEQAFTRKVSNYFDNSVNKGLNTIIVQVRPHGDSFYQSNYYPWSKCVSGTMGKSVDYDPLQIMIDEAHARSLSIHAWVNPYRTMTDKEMELVDDIYPVKEWYNSSKRSSYMVKVPSDGRWWLKPGNAEARQLIIDGVAEIVENYNVDGIHLDDYFYGGDLSLYGDTQAKAKQNNTKLVAGLYNKIKSINSSVQFGISPLAAFREDATLPTSDTNYLSTDLALWCQNSGYIDYIMPQIYWGYDHSSQPFIMTLDKWQDFVTEDSVALYIGLAPYSLKASEIEQQIIDIEDSYRANGFCLFRYDFIHGLDIQ